jgi:hypothetical protein
LLKKRKKREKISRRAYVLLVFATVGETLLGRAGEEVSWFESLRGISAMAEISIVRECERAESGEVVKLGREKLVFKRGGTVVT